MLLDPVSVPCCGKSFDQACLAKHLQAHPRGASCPICRAALPAEVPPVRACEGSALLPEAVRSARGWTGYVAWWTAEQLTTIVGARTGLAATQPKEGVGPASEGSKPGLLQNAK